MSQTIKHRGCVERIERDSVFVAVEQQSACAGCHAKTVCNLGDSQTRVIEVHTPHADWYNVGDSVTVALLRSSMGFSSVVWGYILPLAVLLVVLFGSKLLGAADGPAAVITLASVALYYLLLYVARNHFEQKILFTIIKE